MEEKVGNYLVGFAVWEVLIQKGAFLEHSVMNKGALLERWILLWEESLMISFKGEKIEIYRNITDHTKETDELLELIKRKLPTEAKTEGKLKC